MLTPLSRETIALERNNLDFPKWFLDGLNEFLIEIDDYLTGKKTCKACKLELFYFYDPTLTHIRAYKNGIWIKVNNINGVNIWLLIVLSTKVPMKMAVKVFSEIDLKCTPLKKVESYSAPNKNPPYEFGIWVTDIKKVSPRWMHTWCDIIKQICDLLPCLCNVKKTGKL